MLSIGEFSKICLVTTKTLRYYDEIGLLKPAHISGETGYRYYDISQAKVLFTINRLKEYELSLEEIASVLNDGSEETLLQKLQLKEKELEIKAESYNLLLNNLKKEIKEIKQGVKFMSHLDNLEVKLIEPKPMNILYSRQRMNIAEFDKYFGKLFFRAAQEKLTIKGALAIYHSREFDPNDTDIELGLHIEEAVKGTRDLDPGLCATVRLEGPYSELPGAYAKIVAWIEKEGYEITMPPFEIYLTNPEDTKPEDHITEIYFPVKKK